MKNKINVPVLLIRTIILLHIILFGCVQSAEEEKKEKTVSVWKDQYKIMASDAAEGDEFGKSVAISGDYVISATLRDSVYIYHKTGSNAWDAGTKITAGDGTAGDRFGYSVSISGNYAIVGSPYNDNGGVERGAAYIFHRTEATSWDAGFKISASDTENQDMFGSSVSIFGDYAIVGAPFHGSSGAAYLFLRNDVNTWGSVCKITSLSDAEDDDRFGNAVSIYGDYAIVGAYFKSSEDFDFSGAAYIFQRTGIGNNWTSPFKVSAGYSEEYDYFGNSVSIYGDYAIVGAGDADTFGSNSGTAYIFHRTDSNTWDAGHIIYSVDSAAGDKFGYSVSIYGDYAIAGSPFHDSYGDRSGASYIFHRTGINDWDAGTKIKGYDTDELDFFGYSVALSQTYAVIGASAKEEVSTGNGAAYIFKK